MVRKIILMILFLAWTNVSTAADCRSEFANTATIFKYSQKVLKEMPNFFEKYNSLRHDNTALCSYLHPKRDKIYALNLIFLHILNDTYVMKDKCSGNVAAAAEDNVEMVSSFYNQFDSIRNYYEKRCIEEKYK